MNNQNSKKIFGQTFECKLTPRHPENLRRYSTINLCYMIRAISINY